MTTATCQGPGCGVEFEAKRGAKYHVDRCRKAAARARATEKASASTVDQAEESGAGTDQKPTAETEYGRDVLASVRTDLAKAGQLDTPRGRVALYLARKSIDPDCKNPAAMFKQMLDALDAAIAASAADGPAPTLTTPPENEVDKARRKRAEKAAGVKP